MKILRLIFALAAFAASAAPSAAQLTWTAQRIEKIAAAQQDTVEARFHFKNSGSHDITILSAETSCGCTTASLEKKTYSPGEEGDIIATFSVEDRSGVQEKEIGVVTTDTTDKPTVLTLVVTIPQTFTLNPRRLVWGGDDRSKEPKTAVLTATSEHPVVIKEITCDHPNFKVESVADEAGRRYRIVVTPTSIDEQAKATLRVHISVAGGPSRMLLIQAATRPPARS
jgi:hypothetical protein